MGNLGRCGSMAETVEEVAPETEVTEEPQNTGVEVEKKKKKKKKKVSGGVQSVFESMPAKSRADVGAGTGGGSEFDQPEPSTFESMPKESKADTSATAAAG